MTKHNFPGPANLMLFLRKAPKVERVFDASAIGYLPDRNEESQCYPWDEAEYKVGPDAKARFWWITIEGTEFRWAPYCCVEQGDEWCGEMDLGWDFHQEIAARFEQAPWVTLDTPTVWRQ